MTKNTMLNKLVQNHLNEEMVQIREVVESAIDNNDIIPLVSSH